MPLTQHQTVSSEPLKPTLNEADLRLIDERINITIDKKFDEAFDRKFDQKFLPAFMEAFNKMWNDVMWPALEQTFVTKKELRQEFDRFEIKMDEKFLYHFKPLRKEMSYLKKETTMLNQRLTSLES